MRTQPLRVLAWMEAATVTGPAKNLLEFARTATGDGIEVSIATFVRGTGAAESNPFIEAVRAAGLPLDVVPERSAIDRDTIARMRAVVRRAEPHILQTHAVKSHFLTWLSNAWRERPWVAFHHGYTTTDWKMRAYNQLDRLSLRRPARVVTVSRAFERQLIAQAGVARSRITVLHNAVNDAWAARVASIPRDAARRSLGLRPEDCVLLSIGRMSNEKGHIYLIDAARLLHARGRAVRLLMVGDGPERERLQAASDGALVTFTGQLSDPAACYAAADIMVLPSLSEGSPNVLLESMAAGLPVVATIAGGIPEIVADRESALLVPPRSPDALAAAVEEMLSRPGLRATLANCARAVIAARHTPEARARVLVELYRDLCPIS